MKRLILIVMALMLMVGSVSAITSFSRAQSVGYSTANLIVGTTNADSAVKKIVFFYGTDRTALTRQDSITTVTNEDTLAVTGLNEGTTYFWYVQVTDSTTVIYEPSDLSGYSFTTTDLQQNTTVSSVSYSTANIIVDSTGLGIGVEIDSARLDIDLVDGTTYSASITTVTFPQDTFAVTGLEEGATYFARTMAYLTDSSAADTLTAISFTMIDLGSSVSVLRSNVDSLIIIIDTTTILAETLIVQWGAGLRGITANADTTGSPNGPDTVTITGIIEGSTISLRVLSLLVDSAAVDTGAVLTYSRPSNRFVNQYSPDNVDEIWPSDVFDVYFDWEFDRSSDSYTTGFLPIVSEFIRIHAAIDGEDDAQTYDSLAVFLWSHEFGDSTIVDTIIVRDVDTTTITPLSFRMQPGNAPDTSLDVYPQIDWGTHYSISADMTDSSEASYADSALGIRSVRLTIETVK